MINEYEYRSLRDIIDHLADKQPEIDFLICPETKRVLTFRGLQNQARNLCRRFREMGLAHGDKIALLMENGLYAAQMILGTMYGGFVSVPLNVSAGVAQLSYTLDHCDAKVVFVESKYDDLIKDVAVHIRRPLEIVSADYSNCIEVTKAPFTTDELFPISAEDAALLIYTSGSTGQPKGPLHTHRSVLAHGRNLISSLQLTAADRSLLVLPLYHMNAESVTLVPMLMSGGSVVIPQGFVVNRFWDLLDDYRCTWSALVPTILSQLLEWTDAKAERRAADLRRIRFLRASSAPLSPSLEREFCAKFKLPLIQAMGSTEAGNIFSNPVTAGRSKIGSPGLPWGFETKIVDRDGVEVPVGESGEVLIRGDGMMQGYYKNPLETAAAMDANGWLRTGDLAYKDEDGYFFVVGRAKELIIKGGVNIAPREIDEILEAHPAVLEAAAVGAPDRYVGEDLVAFVVLRDGMACTEPELISFCESHLGGFKTPARIYFVQDLPKGPSGKVQRLRLMDQAERLTVAGSDSLVGHWETSVKNPNATQSKLFKFDAPLEQFITKVWSDILSQHQIGPEDNFFALGGTSMLAIRCLSRFRKHIPVVFSLSDFFENATVAQQSALVRNRLYRFSATDKTRSGQPQADLQPIPPRNRTLPSRLSPSQERLWFIEQLTSGAPVYNEAEAVRLNGRLDVGVMEQALNVIIARHEILRTTIEARDGQPVAVVHENWLLKIEKIDMRSLPSGQHDAELTRLLIDEPRRLYHLEAEPGIRATVIQLSAEEHVFVLMMHHIICDRFSVGVLWRELRTLYDALLRGLPCPLPPLPVQYSDYANWRRDLVQQARFEEDLSFWKEKLRGAPKVLELPADRSRPSVISYRGDKLQFRLDSALVKDVRELCRQERSSLFTIFAAALNTLICRYTGQDDILIGVPIADRDRPELQPLIGFLIDTHVLRTDLSGNPTFRELMVRVQQGMVDVYSHRAAPFDQVVGAIQPERGLGNLPVIQVVLNWREGDTLLQFAGLPGLAIEPLLAQCGTSKFDLTLAVTDNGNSIQLEMEYSTDLFEKARIVRMVGHLCTLFKCVVANPDQRLASLSIMNAGERRLVLETFNDNTAFVPETTLSELFEAQAAQTPTAIALIVNEQRMSYAELDSVANQLAHHLIGLRIGPESVVGVALRRSSELIVALIAILKAGAAYLPLDPEYPAQRLRFMITDADAKLLITTSEMVEDLSLDDDDSIDAELPPLLLIDAPALKADVAAQPDTAPTNSHRTTHLSPANLAYVIYTSGSTGQPKGVEICHANVVALAWRPKYARLGPDQVVLQLAPVAFDASTFEIWGALLNGARLVLAPAGRLDLDNVAQTISSHEIDTLWLTAGLFRQVVETHPHLLAGVTQLLAGGDVLPIATVRRALEQYPALTIINGYGPTETTTFACTRRITSQDLDAERIPIGSPIANTRVYVLDKNLSPTPVGIAGELFISGAGLARGYLRRAELTKERFIACPFGPAGARMYRTGDRARWRLDGALDFLGRADGQIKIRGFRIEPGEIEAALTSMDGVGQAAVALREIAGDTRLVAYFVPQANAAYLPTSELRAVLATRLPDFMVPAAFVQLNKLPLTPNGKLDHKHLPTPMLTTPGEPRPLTKTERRLAEIWKNVLGLDEIDKSADFFELGGHSLLALRLLALVEAEFARRIGLPALFKGPTVEGLARMLDNTGEREFDFRRVVKLHSSSTEPEIFGIHSTGSYFLLAKLLGVKRPLTALQLFDPSYARERMPESIEQVATDYVRLIRRLQPRGPYRVLGWCVGGVLAFEVAQQLVAAGEEVSFLGLVESYAPIHHTRFNRLRSTLRNLSFKAQRLPIVAADLEKVGVGKLDWQAFLVDHQKLARFLRRWRLFMPAEAEARSSTVALDELQGADYERWLTQDYLGAAVKRYRPRVFPGLIHVFRGSKMPKGIFRENLMGWDRFAKGGVELSVIDGDHYSIFRPPGVGQMAQKISAALAQVERPTRNFLDYTEILTSTLKAFE